uniref:Uncharacterized protein n=1 Tax=Caenorhabditis japonica TaxID=281687 RepID=A0A8R1IJF6_CAEJA
MPGTPPSSSIIVNLYLILRRFIGPLRLTGGTEHLLWSSSSDRQSPTAVGHIREINRLPPVTTNPTCVFEVADFSDLPKNRRLLIRESVGVRRAAYLEI